MIHVSNEEPIFEYGVQLGVEAFEQFEPGSIVVRDYDPREEGGLPTVSIRELRHLSDALGRISTYGQAILAGPGQGRKRKPCP